MKISPFLVVQGPGRGRIKIIWRGVRVVPNSRIMAQAIRVEQEAARRDGRAFEPWRCIHGFQLATGALRLSNAAANLLLTVVYKAMEEESDHRL